MISSNNYLSVRQLGILLFIICVPFKMAMLPCLIAGNSAHATLFTAIFVALIEATLACLVIGICKRGGLIECYHTQIGSKKTLSAILMCAVSFFCLLKLCVYMTEFVNYVSIGLFDELEWSIIICTAAPFLFFVATRKTYVIGRSAELMLVLLGLTAIFSLIFNTVDLDTNALKPLFIADYKQFGATSLKFLWWTGDCLPLAFFKLKPSENDAKTSSLYISPPAIFATLSAYFVLLLMIYGNALPLVPNTFARIAIFNKMSDELGAIEWPFIISWLCMASIALSMLMKCTYETLRLPFKKPLTGSLIAFAVLLTAILLPPKNTAYEHTLLMDTPFGYVGIAFAITIVILAITQKKYEKTVL